eukprot:gene14260-14381_t
MVESASGTIWRSSPRRMVRLMDCSVIAAMTVGVGGSGVRIGWVASLRAPANGCVDRLDTNSSHRMGLKPDE